MLFTYTVASRMDLPMARKQFLPVARRFARDTVARYAREQGKMRWCDKSLPSCEYADLLLDIFPRSRFLCLYRNCFDSVASLAEATYWDRSAFGVDKYTRVYTSNNVAAYCAYWADKTEQILTFESRYPQKCWRLRYEDLVTSPTEILPAMFDEFLGLSWHMDEQDRSALFSRQAADGPGDLKVRFTTDFVSSSIGRGWTVPDHLLPDPLRTRIVALEQQLGYTARQSAEVGAEVTTPGRLPLEIRKLITKSYSSTFTQRRSGTIIPSSFSKVAIASAAGDWRFVVDLSARQLSPEGETNCVLTTDLPTLLDMIEGDCNPATAAQQGRVIVHDGTNPLAFRELLEILDAVIPVVRG
jgi:hypothetical protein